jgi:hypothetical protein
MDHVEDSDEEESPNESGRAFLTLREISDSKEITIIEHRFQKQGK